MSGRSAVAEILALLIDAGWSAEESDLDAFSASAPNSLNECTEWLALATSKRGGALATGQAIVASNELFATLLTGLESSRGALPPGLDRSGYELTPLPGRPLIEHFAACARDRGWAQTPSIPESWSWCWGSDRPRALVVVLRNPPPLLVGATCRFVVHFRRFDELLNLAKALVAVWSTKRAREDRLNDSARMAARYRSRCFGCGLAVLPGDPIFRSADRWVHYECVDLGEGRAR